jgi:hypothetical protein
LVRVQNPVDVHEAWARDDVLDFSASVLLYQSRGEREFFRVAGREVRVSALGRARQQSSVHPRQEGNAEARACCNQRDGAVRVGFAFAQNFDLIGRENRHGPRERFQVVQQVSAWEVHLRA